MENHHSRSSTAGSPDPIRCSTARFTAPITTALGRVAGTLTLTALGASTSLAQVGTNYCTAVPNSTGAPALIAGSGSAVVSQNYLVLWSSNLPQNVTAFFLSSRSQDFVQNPGGNVGNICLGNPIGRVVGGMITNSGVGGFASALANLTAMPQPTGAVVVQPGETWNFQCWYRDVVGGGATANLSGGLEVLFTAGGGGPIPGMVPIPAGTFLMGSNAVGPPYFGPFGPVHQVTISHPFWMGQHEVTQAQYEALVGSNPSDFPGASRPVERVNWQNARVYCTALTAQQASLGNIPAGYEYRLPTEAEWEYACRAGTTTEFHYGLDLFCNQARFWYSYHSNSYCHNTSGTAPVGSYAPNAFGLYDMHGNVWEWCLDSYAPYSSAPVTDPFFTAPLDQDRVIRGGSWGSNSNYCLSAYRGRYFYGFANDSLGFRVVLAPVLVP